MRRRDSASLSSPDITCYFYLAAYVALDLTVVCTRSLLPSSSFSLSLPSPPPSPPPSTRRLFPIASSPSPLAGGARGAGVGMWGGDWVGEKRQAASGTAATAAVAAVAAQGGKRRSRAAGRMWRARERELACTSELDTRWGGGGEEGLACCTRGLPPLSPHRFPLLPLPPFLKPTGHAIPPHFTPKTHPKLTRSSSPHFVPCPLPFMPSPRF